MNRITYTGQDLSYVEAFKATKGRLPSHVLQDDVLIEDGEECRVLRNAHYYWAWCREIIAYPDRGGAFAKGRDVIDGSRDDKGRQWILPAKYVPKETLLVQGIALFIDPKEIKVTETAVTIIPKTVTIVRSFPQQDGWNGLDPVTRVPVKVDDVDVLEDNQKRYLFRTSGIGVRPLSRGYDLFGSGRRYVIANYRYSRLGVGVAQRSPSGKTDQNHVRLESHLRPVAEIEARFEKLRKQFENPKLTRTNSVKHKELIARLSELEYVLGLTDK
jgi:hypothetical protein